MASYQVVNQQLMIESLLDKRKRAGSAGRAKRKLNQELAFLNSTIAGLKLGKTGAQMADEDDTARRANVALQAGIRRKKNPEKYRAYDNKWSKENPEKSRARQARYAAKHPEKMRAKWKRHQRKRLDTQPAFRAVRNLRRRIGDFLNGKCTKNSTELLGTDLAGLKLHLESLFKPGMTWENYGPNGWHIDHKLPCASFDLALKEQQLACFNFKNLQPLWALENRKKADRIL